MSSFNSMNKAMILGRLGRDPELKYATSGTAICNFSVATSESVKKGDNWEEKTEWHNVVTFGNQAENCSKFLKKGSLCMVEGRIQTRSYQDKSGVDRYRTEIIAQNIKFLDPREGAGMGERTYQSAPPKAQPQPQKQYNNNNSVNDALVMDNDDDDDLPF